MSVNVNKNINSKVGDAKKLETPWKNGYWYSDKYTPEMKKFDGNEVHTYSILSLDYPDIGPVGDPGTITYGDFGPARKEVQKAAHSGKNYNVKISVFNGTLVTKGIISEDGKIIYSWGMWNDVEALKWMSDQDLKVLAEGRDHKDNPSCPYKIQPENQGKLVWLSGPPGAGKSTTGQLMSREAGFVYLEVDCIMNFLNPFVPTDVDNPSVAGFRQKAVKGVPREYLDIVRDYWGEYEKIDQGNLDGIDSYKMKEFYKVIAQEIDVQRKRVGGDFAVAQAVTSRKFRDYIRLTLPDCFFVTLSMTKGNQAKRIKERHGDDPGTVEYCAKFFEWTMDYEGPAEDEKNTFNVEITEDMTPKDVMSKVLEILDKVPVESKCARELAPNEN